MGFAPRLLITLGDVAGIGPEIVAKGWRELVTVCRPVVVGDPGWLRHALQAAGETPTVAEIQNPGEVEPTADLIPCLRGSDQDLREVVCGRVSGKAGRAAYDFLCTAIDLTMAGMAQGIVTCPLHKEGLRAAGLPYPGHTEILGERTGTANFGMMLHLPRLSVIHVTLHMALRDVFGTLTTNAVLDKIRLLDALLPRLLDRQPRIGVAALNPHASDGGLFGDEEETIIRPAVKRAESAGIEVSGPWPADTLFVRARNGEFDAIVAMYHDQGHIAIKLLGEWAAVNISVGLPITRTSVAHGTAYDIAGKGVADPRSLIEAARVAAKLAASQPGAVRGDKP